jgi:ferredoxin-NADP reductase
MIVTNCSSDQIFPARLVGIRYAAKDVNLYEFERTDGQLFPGTQPGAHVDLILPNKTVRQYSLVSAADSPRSYIIGVKLDPNSRGGSRYIHESMRVGETFQLSAPRNNFRLVQDAAETIFIAGGSGITPIWCMIQRLSSLKKKWKLHYACRSRGDAAFAEQLAAHEQVHLHFDDENQQFMDINKAISKASRETHLYCCGPHPMLEAFETATRALPPAHIHVEYFTPKLPPSITGGFTVELKRSGKSFFIPSGKTILEVLLAAGFRLHSSCEQGVCGATR